MMEGVVDATSKLLKSCKASEVEIEARIRRQLVNEVSHALLLSNLGVEWEEEVYIERRRISKSDRKCAYRQRSSFSAPGLQIAGGRTASERSQHSVPVTICKSSIAREDINDAWCAFHVSVETLIPSMSHSLAGVAPVVVTRHRGVMEGHYVDAVYDEGQGYRVEVEVCKADHFDPESTLRVVRRVCTVLQGSRYFVGYYDWVTVVHVANTPFGSFCIDSGDYQKPRTMTMNALSEIADGVSSWLVTPKADGERRFIIALGSRVFSIGQSRDVRLEGAALGNSRHPASVYILDCEYTKDSDEFHVFDAIVENGAYLGEGGDLLNRLEKAGELIDMMPEDLRARVSIKAHHRFDSFDRLCLLYDEFKGNSRYSIDGMVFVNTEKGYMQQVPKWKQHSTVDLMVANGKLTTCDGWEVTVPVRVEQAVTESRPASLTEVLYRNNIADGVWEFCYEGDALVPERPRPDKRQANSKNIVETNMLRAVPGSIFSGVGCYLMRKYHNRVKAAMIRGANDKKAVILDIGTGQGGDVGKWKKAAAVYCIEPSVPSTEEMIDRYGRMHNVTVVNVHLKDFDYTKVDKKVDIFTAFFCMNQFKDPDWDALKRLVTERGSSKCRLLAIAMTSPRTHKGECFDIKMNGVDRYNIRIHGTRIDDINERIVDPAVLTSRMKKCGMELVKHSRLDGNNFMTKEERRLSSMYEMFVYKKQKQGGK